MHPHAELYINHFIFLSFDFFTTLWKVFWLPFLLWPPPLLLSWLVLNLHSLLDQRIPKVNSLVSEPVLIHMPVFFLLTCKFELKPHLFWNRHSLFFYARSTFLPGSYFDLRVELHAYDKDTSKPTPKPYDQFKTTIRKDKGKWVDVNKFFKIKSQPVIENWKFNWTDSIEKHYASVLQNGQKPIQVAVAARAWRKLRLTEPGLYEIKVQYGSKKSYTVQYQVVEVDATTHPKHIIYPLSLA